MAGIDDETPPPEPVDADRPTAQPSSLASTDPVRPGFDVFAPNLDQVSAATFRRGTLSRRRVNRALVMILSIAVLTTLLVIFGDFVFARLGSLLDGGLAVVLALGTVGLVLLLRGGRRTARDRDR